MIKLDKGFLGDSSWLFGASASMGLGGILFWWFVAKFYSIDNLGLGAVLISISSLLIFLASLGTMPTYIRFIPVQEDKDGFLGTFFSLTLILTVVLCLVTLAYAYFLLPRLGIFGGLFYPLLFLSLVIFTAVFQVMNGIFVAFKSPDLVFIKNVTQNFLRLLILCSLFSWGGFGIFAANGLASLIAVILSGFIFYKRHPGIRLSFQIKYHFVKKMFFFSASNFASFIPLNLPGLIFPILLFQKLSARETGVFYIPWMMFFVFCTFVTSVTNVFLMKASYGQKRQGLITHVVLLTLLIGLAGFVVFGLYGGVILSVFKAGLSPEASLILKVLFSSIFFFIIVQVYIAILNMQKKTLEIALISAATILVMIAYIFYSGFERGGEALARAWLVSNFSACLYVLLNCCVKAFKKRRIDLKSIGVAMVGHAE